MNRVSLTGRLVKDPDIRYTTGEKATCVARFTIAAERRFKMAGQPTADFITCVAFGKTGEFIDKYFTKGMKADIGGRIQTGSYVDKNGDKKYTTDVVVEELEFGESKKNQGNNEASGAGRTADGISHDIHIEDLTDDDDLPFH